MEKLNIKFDPKTLEPFDKVLVRNEDSPNWCCSLFSHSYHCNIIDYFVTLDNCVYRDIIPYNEQTKHLLGTTNEPPEYYKYWEFKYYES